MNIEGNGSGIATNRLAAAVDLLPPAEAMAVRAWLGATSPNERFLPGVLTDVHEPISMDLRRASPGDPRGVRTVGVIGGGTAGYLTALALREKRPWLDVSLVESRDIPVIGVGEATVPEMVWFLHHYLSIDPVEFFSEVRPTWKLGIKFAWGPDPSGFTAPFD
jgi:tryptophan halogenase